MPANSAKVTPHVINIIGAPFCNVLKMFVEEKKVLVVNEKNRINEAKNK